MIAMNAERWVLLSVWVICLPALFLGVARARWREMVLVFLWNQTYTWSMSLVLVEGGLVSNPVREFVRASGSNFSFNFILYPTIAVFYALHVPRGAWRNVLQLGLFMAGLGVFTETVSSFTSLMDMQRLGWPLRILVFGVGLASARIGYLWYFGRGPFGAKGGGERADMARDDALDGV
ncbi:CBO0543 family protein [Paenibacillus xanthanilyticus]|uniref:CBO0543 family protein n=1 Tax=Paenibacillus xanthanilyticus TaxID=1783531 RepID=A0ABV8K2Q7_9BACL